MEKNNPPAQDKKDFIQTYWRPWLWPVCTLVAICLVTSVLLALVNNLTLPIIQENDQKAAEQIRINLLPAADGFTAVTGDDLGEGITAVYTATNGAGYVIESYAKGYGGLVPAIVAFDANGKIVGVEFTENDETPGLGQKVYNEKQFAAQFVGKEGSNISAGDIDKIASATISTNAAIKAVNNAIDYIAANVTGSAVELSEAQVRTALFSGAAMAVQLDLNAENITDAWFGDNGNYVIYATAPGFYNKDVTAAVGMDENGSITGVWFDASGETEGVGTEIAANEGFIESFIGKANTSGIDAVAGATVSSDAALAAVENALNALALAKAAPQKGEFEILPSLPLTKDERDAMTEDEILAWLLPGQTLKSTEINGTKAYAGSHDSYIIYGTAPGFYNKDVTAMVAMNGDGKIISLWLDTGGETAGIGLEVQYDNSFTSAFSGVEAGGLSDIETVASATVSSQAAIEAVKNALGLLQEVKGAQ